MTSSGPSPSTASSSSSTEKWKWILLAAGLVLAAGGSIAYTTFEPLVVEMPDPRVAPPLARKLLVIRIESVPRAVVDWPELTPFFNDIRERGRGGTLRGDLTLDRLSLFSERAGIPTFAPSGRGEQTDDLSAEDAGTLAGAAAFDEYRSCVMTMSLDSVRRAVAAHGAELRTGTGSASATALAIRALDQRCFEAARTAGSDSVVVFVREFMGRGADYVAAGPGLAVEESDREMGGDDLQSTLGAILGLATGRDTRYLDGVEVTDAEALAHHDKAPTIRSALERMGPKNPEHQQRFFARLAGAIAVGMGLLLAIRAAWSMRARASAPS